MTRTSPRRRLATVAVLAIGGGALSVGTWVGGQHGFAVGLGAAYLVLMVIAYVWSGGDGDFAAIMRVQATNGNAPSTIGRRRAQATRWLCSASAGAS